MLWSEPCIWGSSRDTAQDSWRRLLVTVIPCNIINLILKVGCQVLHRLLRFTGPVLLSAVPPCIVSELVNIVGRSRHRLHTPTRACPPVSCAYVSQQIVNEVWLAGGQADVWVPGAAEAG